MRGPDVARPVVHVFNSLFDLNDAVQIVLRIRVQRERPARPWRLMGNGGHHVTQLCAALAAPSAAVAFNCRSLLPSMTVQAHTAGACACGASCSRSPMTPRVESMMQIPVALGLCLKYFIRNRVLSGLPKTEMIRVQNLRISRHRHDRRAYNPAEQSAQNSCEAGRRCAQVRKGRRSHRGWPSAGCSIGPRRQHSASSRPNSRYSAALASVRWRASMGQRIR